MMLGAVLEFYISVIEPLLMITLFSTRSITLMEKRQLERKPDYEHYVEITHALIPLPFSKKQTPMEDSDKSFQE